MQTSKSYGTGVNVEIKLELDDLEYVFADGQNLVINSDATEDVEEEGNIVYTDGSQAVILQNGVKHFIQTIGGETYLVGNDSENIQQIVINADDQSEESNGDVEYVQDDDENVQAVIYKLADTDNEIEETEPQAKRFKIGDAEYITLNDCQGIRLDDVNQLGILEEGSSAQNGNIQYAILKDGKLHLQLCQSDSVEDLNDSSEEQGDDQQEEEETDEQEEGKYAIDEEKVQEYVLINTNVNSDDTVDLSKIAGRDLLTGETLTLDSYLDRMHHKINQLENSKESQSNGNSISHNKYKQYLNKKLLIRKNGNGKSLFGKILHIEPSKTSKKNQNANEEVEIQDVDNSETIILDIETDVSHANQVQDENEGPAEEIACDESGRAVAVPEVSQADYHQEVTEHQMNFLSKTLNGLTDMPSLRKKLMEHRLEIKFVEKRYDDETREVFTDVRFVNGCLMPQDSGFVVDESEEQKNVTSLTVTVVHERENKKTTRVTFHEQPVTCQACNRSFRSIGLLNRHVQMYHTDRSLSCNICQLKFANHVLLTEHRKANGHYYNCSTCNKRFTTQSSLRRHQSVHDQNLKHLECVICQARFANVSSLSKHLLIHTHIKAYQCDSCGKAFTTLGDLNVHKRVHNPVKMCYCDICGREFSRHSNLLRHTDIHKGDGDLYKCGICDCSYKYISSLTRHIVQNHMKQEVQDV